MLLPIRTSIRPWKTPYTNYALIAINVFIFFISYSPHYSVVAGSRVMESLRPWADHFMLVPLAPSLWQFVSYAFLHGGYAHIFGNMFFLYIFGNNVNDKLGHTGYLCFYLAGAVFSGIGHTLMSTNPVLGASGAVAAVTGAYLVLFPQTLITVLYWFFFIGTMEIPTLYFIAFKMIILDNVIARVTPNVAYDAHLAGYAFGMLSMLLMLSLGLLNSSGFDLWMMIKQFHRRRRYSDAVSDGFSPFSGKIRAKKIKVKEVKRTTQQKQTEEKTKHLCNEISKRIEQRNLSTASGLYLELIALDKNQIPPRQYLLDIANQLASENKHVEAADAYEKFLIHYSGYEYCEQVQLMLGLIYSRYLHNSELAIKHLKIAASRLSDQDQLKMCQDELFKLQN